MIQMGKPIVNNLTRAVYSARNAMNSWDRSDSDIERDILGKNDLELAKRLVRAGPDHAKFMRMINVMVDITAPRYWWTEFDTYKVGTVANSCSTMHKIHEKEFVIDDFSHEQLTKETVYIMDNYGGYENSALTCLKETVQLLNVLREKFIYTKDKQYWYQMIQLLPQSYNQLRTVSLNYAVLQNMYLARKDHKLDEWRTFCEWIKVELPFFRELVVDNE